MALASSPRERRDERITVEITAQMRTGTGLRDRALVLNLSLGGCCIQADTLFLSTGQRVVVRPDGLEGIPATVRWTEGQSAGLEFLTPLYAPVFDHVVQRNRPAGG